MAEGIDPLFGIHYSSASIEFAPPSAELVKACTALTNDRWDRKMSVFAMTSGPEPRYVVIGGYFLERGAKGKIEADKVGAAVRISNRRCELIAPAREVFDYPSAEIPLSTLKDLAKDAVCRYSHAFGGYGKFMDAVKKQRITLETIQSTVLKEAVFAPPSGCQ